MRRSRSAIPGARSTGAAGRSPPRERSAIHLVYYTDSLASGGAQRQLVQLACSLHGREGVRAIKQAGGRVVAESEQTAVVFGMPHQAIRTGVVDAVLPLPEIASVIESGLAARAPGRGVRFA